MTNQKKDLKPEVQISYLPKDKQLALLIWDELREVIGTALSLHIESLPTDADYEKEQEHYYIEELKNTDVVILLCIELSELASWHQEQRAARVWMSHARNTEVMVFSPAQDFSGEPIPFKDLPDAKFGNNRQLTSLLSKLTKIENTELTKLNFDNVLNNENDFSNNETNQQEVLRFLVETIANQLRDNMQNEGIQEVIHDSVRRWSMAVYKLRRPPPPTSKKETTISREKTTCTLCRLDVVPDRHGCCSVCGLHYPGLMGKEDLKELAEDSDKVRNKYGEGNVIAQFKGLTESMVHSLGFTTPLQKTNSKTFHLVCAFHPEVHRENAILVYGKLTREPYALSNEEIAEIEKQLTDVKEKLTLSPKLLVLLGPTPIPDIERQLAELHSENGEVKVCFIEAGFISKIYDALFGLTSVTELAESLSSCTIVRDKKSMKKFKQAVNNHRKKLKHRKVSKKHTLPFE